jgi:menaquinone-9 beta-reductase
MTRRFDVAIIGAGPAGSAAAISLAQRGYDVVLIDKQNFPREKLCGNFVNPINWPLFRDLGVDDRILAEPHCRVSGFRLTAPSGESADASFSQSDQSRSYGLGLARARLDYVLLQRAREAEATVETGCRLQRISKDARDWDLLTSAGEIWKAKILIGADGRNSWVAQQLGMNQHALRGRSVGFQMRLKLSAGASTFSGIAAQRLDAHIGQKKDPSRALGMTSVGADRIEIHLFPGGYAGLINVGEGFLTLGLAIDKRVLPREAVQRFLIERLARNPFLKTVLQNCESVDGLRSAYPVYFSRRCSFDEAVLLVGDAARVTEPVSGEGIYFAMTSGALAADTVDQAMRHGDLSPAYLQRYEQGCINTLRSRMRLNSLLRFAVYRPALLRPLIRWSARNNRLLGTLVDAVCAPAAVH